MGEHTEDPRGKETLELTATVDRRLFVNVLGDHCGAGELAYGVSMDNGVDGEYIAVATEGEILVQASMTLVPNQMVTSDADGKAVAADGVSDSVNGIVKKGAAAAGDEVLISFVRMTLTASSTTTSTTI